MLHLLVLLLALAPARADEAELQRLRSEMHTLASRSTWTGVDRTYRSLVGLGVPLAHEDHIAGYQAALRQGEPLLALYRISRVTDAAGQTGAAWEEARQMQASLAAQYGLVAIVVGPDREPTLERPQMPFAPDQRAAIERATEVLRERRELRGLLPVGTYVVAGKPLEVTGGESWQTLVVD